MTAISDATLDVTCQPEAAAREGCGSPEVIKGTAAERGRAGVSFLATGALPSAQKFLLSLSLSVSQTDEIF